MPVVGNGNRHFIAKSLIGKRHGLADVGTCYFVSFVQLAQLIKPDRVGSSELVLAPKPQRTSPKENSMYSRLQR